jgi:hypothetical protein
LLVAGCWLLVAGCWLLVAGCRLRRCIKQVLNKNKGAVWLFDKFMKQLNLDNWKNTVSLLHVLRTICIKRGENVIFWAIDGYIQKRSIERSTMPSILQKAVAATNPRLVEQYLCRADQHRLCNQIADCINDKLRKRCRYSDVIIQMFMEMFLSVLHELTRESTDEKYLWIKSIFQKVDKQSTIKTRVEELVVLDEYRSIEYLLHIYKTWGITHYASHLIRVICFIMIIKS